jgi:glycosyltransferase involved in cell wall biosynthesis
MTNNNNLSIAFLGTLVPDAVEFHNPAFNRSGNMVQAGIVEGFDKQCIELKVLTSQPIPTFPKYKSLFCKRKIVSYSSEIKITTLPALNIVVIREIMRGLYAMFSLVYWAFENRHKKRCIMVYNVYSPPLPLVYLIGKITKSKTVAVIYDLGMPPKVLHLDIFRKFIYRWVEIFAKLIIPRLDGRIVITEAIARDYAPKNHFLLLDGGIGTSIIDRLFPLVLKPDRMETIFLCAGSLWAGNGINLIIDAMKLNKNQNIKIWFAGKGPDVSLIEDATINDGRIVYLGLLDLDQLFQAYQLSDALLNIRVIPEGEGDYLFPSKLIEYISTGRIVISTNAVHIKRDYGQLCFILNEVKPQALSQIINTVSELSSKYIYEKGITNRQFILNNYTWDKRSIQIINYMNEKVFNNY